ncbi:MAG: CheR family methyltransferase [Pseudomonadota bacterium]|nr:CheR family methyltransferase [Pseudomonadota bacterium]MDP1904546.1 CheR family methyltransferase [Pseudomonadota bacterium]MDP2353952.1 CheR family methyltransferase [Pseudomonadota bacterium]
MPATALPAAIEEQLCLLVRERTGIRILDHQMDTLRRTVADGLTRFGHAGATEYLAALRAARASSPEHEHLIAGITVGESYFFRDQAQMAWLREQWLPQLIARRRAENNLSLRIWSAGSSDGQELYSLAMLLTEQLPDLEQWNLHLLGTDINAEALARALRGRYSEWSLRATPETARKRHFRQEKERVWSISAALRGHVHFAYLNLREDSFPSMLSETTALDLILCRNVFIYFDPTIVAEVMRKFHACLLPGGHLLLGASDLIDSGTLDGFSLHNLENAFYLQSRTFAPAAVEPAPAAERTRPQTPPLVVSHALPPTAAAASYEEITRLLGCEAWREALEATTNSRMRGDDSALLQQFRAKALANLGRAREALEACDASLARDSGDKHSHFLRALILLELHRLPAAEESLRRTLFLDHNFVEAHYQLALLQMRRGARPSGLKSMKNALTIAERAQPDRRLHDAAGRDHERMAAILRHELRMYESDSGYRK